MRRTNEAFTVHGRTDHRDIEGAGGARGRMVDVVRHNDDGAAGLVGETARFQHQLAAVMLPFLHLQNRTSTPRRGAGPEDSDS